MTPNRRLLESAEFADNPEPRCPCLLLVDTSGSMKGERIDSLNEGLRTFRRELLRDGLAARRVEVAVVTFDSAGTYRAAIRDGREVHPADPDRLRKNQYGGWD